MPDEFVNQLHFGDNLVRLRENIPDEVADLIYLDPPFNSNRNYNLLFKQHKGQESPAQIMAFEDTWQWSPLAYDEFKSDGHNAPLWKLVASLYDILGSSEMMAYVVMMAPRLLELHKKLKPTGSLYLHCDPSASHYLKLILDEVFGPDKFVNEIIWKRTSAHSDAKQGSQHYGRIHDVLLLYRKSDACVWNPQFATHDEGYVKTHYPYADDAGRRYGLWDITGPGGAAKGNPSYEIFGVTKYWRYSAIKMQQKIDEGRVIQPSAGAVPREKRYLDETSGVPVGSVWNDIAPINSQAKERRGYPTQKPLALLERIIATSTNPGQIVLDPFAGCGTAIVAAERMGRHWIGIDITYLAINEIVDRLQTEKREGHDLRYVLVGTPTDEDAARALFRNTEHQNHKPFEQWAVTLVGGRWNEKKGADRGIDGRIGLFDLQGNYRECMIQVKGGNSMTLSNVRDFGRVIERENAVCGIMIGQSKITKEMILEAEGMGYADWPGSRKIPRFQILTTQDVLENGAQPILPENYRIGPQTGVGKAVAGQTESLFESQTDD